MTPLLDVISSFEASFLRRFEKREQLIMKVKTANCTFVAATLVFTTVWGIWLKTIPGKSRFFRYHKHPRANAGQESV